MTPDNKLTGDCKSKRKILKEFMKFYQAETYQGICKSLFLQYKLKIQERLPDAFIEHVGASSIHGTISKETWTSSLV